MDSEADKKKIRDLAIEAHKERESRKRMKFWDRLLIALVVFAVFLMLAIVFPYTNIEYGVEVGYSKGKFEPWFINTLETALLLVSLAIAACYFVKYHTTAPQK